MDPPENSSRKSLGKETNSSPIWLFIAFEGGLAALGILLAWAAGFDALGRPSGSNEGLLVKPIALGIGVGLICFAVMSALDRLNWAPLARLREIVEQAMAKLLREASLWQVVALAAAAGIGEEVLFRGFLQQGVADAMKRMEFDVVPAQCAAIGAASLIFGLCHAMTKTYLVAATVMSAILGYLYLYADHILAPIVAHGLYDFVAILYFVRSQKN